MATTSASSAADPVLIERIAGALGVDESLVEKDWHAVRALGAIASVHVPDAIPVFSGGTSLSKGWDLIKRFSEDIDFKVMTPQALSVAQARKLRRVYRAAVLDALADRHFIIQGTADVGNDGRFFSATFTYEAHFPIDRALRRRLKVEMSFVDPALPALARPLQSLVARARSADAEVAAFRCVDPVETAADKLSALSWRAYARDRQSPKDDPTIVRHLHDLAALEILATADDRFASLARETAESDARRAKPRDVDWKTMLLDMPERLARDVEWRREYEQLVDAVSFARAEERIGFDAALDGSRRLVTHVLEK
jgi:predicted nucleotidyltransferase component of viral defense system